MYNFMMYIHRGVQILVLRHCTQYRSTSLYVYCIVSYIYLLHSDEFEKCIRKRAEFSDNEIQRYMYIMSYHMAYVTKVIILLGSSFSLYLYST